MELVEMKVSDLIPYENNPRINYDAIDKVAESIRQCGYVTPIIVDEDNVILAGHTRLEAVKRLNYDTVPCVIQTGLTDDQKRKFRLLDNKTAEIADWDEELLKEELEGLDLDGIDWFDDLLNPNVEELAKEKKDSKPKAEDGIIRCPKCGTIINLNAGDDEEAITWGHIDEQEEDDGN